MSTLTVVKNDAFKIHHSPHVFDSLVDLPFDGLAYSRMKFGSDLVSRRFGYEMAASFFEEHRHFLQMPTVVIPAPSTTVPVAATLISKHFCNRLNTLLMRINHKPVEWTMVHRNMTYNNNYAHLPKEQRKKLLAGDSIFFNHDFIGNKAIIFIDDCKITGTHEEKIISYMNMNRMENDYAFVCYASYSGTEPSIEGELNHLFIKTADDLVELSREPGHRVTTRSLRLFLEAMPERFITLLGRSPLNFLTEVYHCSMVKGYNLHEEYINNFRVLEEFLTSIFGNEKI